MPDQVLSLAEAAAEPAPLRLLIVTDAWHPQVNGVVRTLATIAGTLEAQGDTVEVIGPDRFRTMPMPSYPEIRLALRPRRTLRAMAGRAGRCQKERRFSAAQSTSSKRPSACSTSAVQLSTQSPSFM